MVRATPSGSVVAFGSDHVVQPPDRPEPEFDILEIEVADLGPCEIEEAWNFGRRLSDPRRRGPYGNVPDWN